MDNIKVSVIIPVYNVAPYLKECLDSIINQTLKEIEIICIDDCSTDNSYQILEEYKKKDNRITIIKNEENMGVGYTRNVGEKIARGVYLHFMDPDDYISLNFLTSLYTTAKKYNSDIVQTLNIYTINDGNLNKYWLHIENILSLENKKNISNYMEYESEASLKKLNKKNNIEATNIHLWSKLYKKEFLIKNNLFSSENKIGSGYDNELELKILLHEPKLSHNNNAIYYYRIRKNSIVDRYRKELDRSIYIIYNMNNVIEYYKNKRPDLLNDLYPHVFSACFYVFNESTYNNKYTFYNYIYDFVNSINTFNSDIIDEYVFLQYMLIKNNDTYEKYLLQKTLFDNIEKLNNEISKVIEKQNSKIKLFGIENFNNKIIIYLFGIKIAIKKKN